MNGDGIKSRKFIIAVAALLCATVVTAFGKLDPTAWLDFSKWVIVAYMGGNGLEYVAKKIGGGQ